MPHPVCDAPHYSPGLLQPPNMLLHAHAWRLLHVCAYTAVLNPIAHLAALALALYACT